MELVVDNNFVDSNAFISATELVDGMCMREGDMQKISKPLYLSLFKEEYIRMNLSSIKQTKRILIAVNQDLKCINVPSDYIIFHSIGVPDEHHKFKPLIVNDNIKTDDYIDIHESDICGCDCGCDNPYCANVKNYELIESRVTANMPNGDQQVFPSYIRKKLLSDGSLVTEISEPVERYDNNQHVATELRISEEFAAKLELKSCGCIKKTEENDRLINDTCDAVDFGYESGCCKLHAQDYDFYKINDVGNRIHFPANFPHKKVLLRYFADTKTKNIKIPILTARVMRASIKIESLKWSKTGISQLPFWQSELKNAVIELNKNLSKLKLIDFYVHVLGKFRVL